MEIDRLIELHPRLYHMAEAGTWASIKKRGLLSTSAVLDLHGVKGKARAPYESEQRKAKMEVLPETAGSIILRDQRPMPPSQLERALKGTGMTPREWYRLINKKVFFWADTPRLIKLLNAYGEFEHDVLTIDAERFIRAYRRQIWLCHMNSGNTRPMPHPRGPNTFRRIADYPVDQKGKPEKAVAELVVDDSVPDIADFVIEVRRMKGDRVIRRIAL